MKSDTRWVTKMLLVTIFNHSKQKLIPQLRAESLLTTLGSEADVDLFFYVFNDLPGADQIQQQCGRYQRLCFPPQAADGRQDAVLLVVRSIILSSSNPGHFV